MDKQKLIELLNQALAADNYPDIDEYILEALFELKKD